MLKNVTHAGPEQPFRCLDMPAAKNQGTHSSSSDSISHKHHLPHIGHRPLSFFRISQPSWIIYLTPGSLFLHSRLPSLATLYVPSPRVFRTLFLFWNSLTLFSHFSSYLRVFQTVFPLLKHSHAFLTQAHSCLRVFQILFLVWNTLTPP